MDTVYHIRIKKEYAAAVIEDLEKMDAVELLSSEAQSYEIPQWQQDEVIRRIEARKNDPSLVLSREQAEARLKAFGK